MQEKGHTFADLSSEVQEKARDQMVIGWCLDMEAIWNASGVPWSSGIAGLIMIFACL